MLFYHKSHANDNTFLFYIISLLTDRAALSEERLLQESEDRMVVVVHSVWEVMVDAH